MRNNAMSSMYADLAHEKIEFVGCESRNVKKMKDGLLAYADFGILLDQRDDALKQDRLAEALAIAKRWDVYLVVMPHVREVRVYWDEEAFNSPILSNEMAVCFIQKGVFKTFFESNDFVRYALMHNFLYLQEDERLLNLEDMFRRTEEALIVFEKHAYDATQLESNSKQLRQYLLDEHDQISNQKEASRYLDTSFNREVVENVYNATFCIRMICKKE